MPPSTVPATRHASRGLLTPLENIAGAPRSGVCSLVGTAWRSTYETATSGIEVTDNLSFNADLSLTQTLTATAGQGCTVNSISWTGDYDVVDASTALVSYIRCAASGPGCLNCGASREELTRLKFANDCSSMTLVVANDDEARIYFAA